MNNLYEIFVKKLIEQTKEGLIEWDTVNVITNKFNVDDFDFLLFTTEFHTINLLYSYGVVSDKLNIFLLDEIFESGKDGSVSSELNLYVTTGIRNKSYKIPVDNSGLMVLKEEVHQFISTNKYLENLIKKYMDDN